MAKPAEISLRYTDGWTGKRQNFLKAQKQLKILDVSEKVFMWKTLQEKKREIVLRLKTKK